MSGSALPRPSRLPLGRLRSAPAASISLAGLLRGVFGSSAGGAQRLVGVDRALRTALPVSRRISFLAAAGGSGTTSAVASSASLLARRRPGMVLTVHAAAGRSGLTAQLDPETVARPDPEFEVSAALRRGARTAAEARQGLARSGTGAYLLDLDSADDRPASAAEWRFAVGPIARFFDLVLTDWGVRPTPAEVLSVAAESHLVVVVGRSEPAAAADAAGLAYAVTRTAPAEAATAAMLVLVDAGRCAAPTAAGWRRRLGLPVLVLPNEPARLRSVVPDSRTFRPATREAHLALAATLVSAALGVPPPTSEARR